MQDISNMNREGLPSSKSLIKATAIAALIGVLLLTTTILPAEYGIDPTGLGKQMGLTTLSDVDEPTPAEADTASGNLLTIPAGPVWKTQSELSTDITTVTLAADEGLEVKASMKAGDRMVFNWASDGGPVDFDMHGERIDDGDNFTSYWKGTNESVSNGALEAPFDGTHGWYWRNRGAETVTIVLETSGFYSTIAKK